MWMCIMYTCVHLHMWLGSKTACGPTSPYTPRWPAQKLNVSKTAQSCHNMTSFRNSVWMNIQFHMVDRIKIGMQANKPTHSTIWPGLEMACRQTRWHIPPFDQSQKKLVSQNVHTITHMNVLEMPHGPNFHTHTHANRHGDGTLTKMPIHPPIGQVSEIACEPTCLNNSHRTGCRNDPPSCHQV